MNYENIAVSFILEYLISMVKAIIEFQKNIQANY